MRTKGIKRLSKPQVKCTSKHFLVYKYLIRDLQIFIGEYARGSVIDLGCGNKPYETYFKGITSSYIGVDVVQSSDNKVDIISDVTQLPLENNSFDTVFTTQVIEHVFNHKQLVGECYRVLKPKGVLILTCPMYWPLHEEPYDFFRFTKHGLRNLLENEGFKITTIKPNGKSFSVAGLALLHAFPFSFKPTNFLINIFFYSLDKFFGREDNTSNYLVIATK